MSLYLKYRPQDFSSVVGQSHVVKTIQNALKRNALAHAYLFSGPRGTGKTSLARIIAKALNCRQRQVDSEPCSQCEICQDIQKGRLVDLIEIDAASNRGIDEIRELREKIQFAPTHARSKVYIIDEVHMLTKEAFNALLKTLEEPPEHAYFILATTEAHKIPETIVSRCQQFSFKRIDHESIKLRLEQIAELESIEADPEALALIAKMAVGSLRDAIGLLEQMNLDGRVKYETVAKNLGLSGGIMIEAFVEALRQKNALKALEFIGQLNAQGKNLHQFTGEVLGFLREQMLIHLENSGELTSVLELIDVFSTAKQQINSCFIPHLPLEMAIVKVCGNFIGKPPRSSEKPKEAQEPLAPEEVKSRPSETKIPQTLSLQLIKSQWQRVMDAIETPFIRVSFMDGEPTKFEKGELLLAFQSDSLMEKVRSHVNQAQIQKAFEAVFDQKIKLRLELKKVNLKPMAAAPKGKEPNLVEMAKEIFGG